MLATPILAALLAFLLPDVDTELTTQATQGSASDAAPGALEQTATRGSTGKRAPRAGTTTTTELDGDYQTIDLDDARTTAADRTATSTRRQTAVRAIAFRSTRSADLDLLATLLIEDQDLSIRFLCARALEHRKSHGPELAQALQLDPDARVRRAAARALGKLGPDGTRQETALIAALEDPDPVVGEQAAESLYTVGSRASIGMLTSASRRHPSESVQDAAKRALRQVQRRASDREAARVRAKEAEEIRKDPRRANPLLWKILNYGGTPYATIAGGVIGLALGSLVPLAIFGTRYGTWGWPLGAAGGALVGAGAGFGYGAVRLFRFPLLDAVLISAHSASGAAAGVGIGLALGRKSTAHYSAGLGVLGGAGATILSAAVNPFFKTRPSGLVGTLSGGMFGAAIGLLGSGAFGVDVFQKPQLAMGLALVGQGVGTITGTLLAAGAPFTAQDIVLVDVGAVTGGAAMAGASVAVLGFVNLFGGAGPVPGSALTAGQANGMVLAGMVLGAGTGALVAAFLPNILENRLQSGLQWEDIPIRLTPSLPVPVAQNGSTKVSGALLPVLSGTFN